MDQVRLDTSVDNQTAYSTSVPGVVASLKRIWGGFREQHAAFLITCIYLVFEYNKPQSVYPGLDLIPWGKTLIFLAILLMLLDSVSKPPPVAAALPMLGFSFCVLSSMFFAFSPAYAAREWVTFFSWFFVVLLLTGVITTRQRLFLFLATYFLVNLKMAQHGFRSWAMGGFGFSGWGVSGSPGWFQNSGEFSLEMVVFLPIVLAFIMKFHRQWSPGVKFLFFLLAIMSTGSIIASSSRGGVLGLVMVGVWYLAYSRQRVKALIVLVLVAGIVYLVMPPEFKARFEAVGEDKTSVARLAYWERGKEAVREHPLTGIGYRNWTIWVSDRHPELMKKVGEFYHAQVIHNTYLETATELGVPGAAAYLAILLQIFFTNRRSVRIARLHNDHFLEATAQGLNGSLLAYLVPSYFIAVLYYPYVWILLALTVSLSRVCNASVASFENSAEVAK